MSEFVLNRNYTLASLTGRIINFKKGEPVYVPPQCEKEALQIGAEPIGGKKDILDPEQPEAVELTVEERAQKLKEAFDTMMNREQRGDFSAQGVPNLKVLTGLVGFDVDARERDAAWQEYSNPTEE